MFEQILSLYGIDTSDYLVSPFGDGLINHTWKVVSAGKEWLLQRINRQIFLEPEDILINCSQLSAYFKNTHSDYLFIAPLTHSGKLNFVKDKENNYYRLFPFVRNSYTCNTVLKPELAREAAGQFGKFTRLLSDFPSSQLRITLPDFHNLSLRQEQFETAIRNGDMERINRSAEEISFLQRQSAITDIFRKIKENQSFPIRVVHHDAKINNVLFELGTDRGMCVIDLDTVMPGYYFSDVGDMLRTHLCPVGEEVADLQMIEIREDYFKEIVAGYLSEMNDVLTGKEKKYFVYAGKFAIYMQAIRFLTDYLQKDKYYSIQYPEQNFVRARNQIMLLKKYLDKENTLENLMHTFQS